MASSEYIYDEDGEVWPFFVLSILTFILLPITISWAYRAFIAVDSLSSNAKIKGAILENSESVEVNNVKEIKKYRNKQQSSRIFNKTLIFLIIGWSIVFYINKNLTQYADIKSIFDPYLILDIPSSSTDREVKSRYRKLSLKIHPDKLPKDITEQEKINMEATFIRINLAYKALTDEVTRNNFLKYGHPDGPQDITHGIALPKFLVEGKYSPIMIVIYFLLIGVLLPAIVGLWWNNVKSHTKKGLHVDTAALWTRKLTDRNPSKVVTPYVILDWILDSIEVKSAFPHLTKQQLRNLVDKHFNREFSSDAQIESDKVKLISLLPKLISGLIDITIVFRNTEIIFPASDLQKAVLQAVKPTGKYQEILQLPYVDAKVVENQDVKRLGKLFTLSKEELPKVLGVNDPIKIEKILDIASHIPSLRVIESEFVVPGEDVIPPKSQAHLALKFLVKSPRLKSSPEIEESRLKEEETLDYLRNPLKSNETQPELPFSYAPYFSYYVRNNWSGYLISQKDNKLVEDSTAYKLENIDLSNLEINQKEWIDGKEVIIGTFKIPLSTPTPEVIGTYNYRVVLKNNSYFGSDVDIPLYLEVKNPPMNININKSNKEIDSDDESDISDPEEDSLAGALAALRGQSTKKITEITKEEEDDDEESDTESIFTDINTDTEDEAE
ncbi:uncharacterized protein RJT21DRAFT_117441 [Scheffersomyces amazonensis]|uniref:uncharacterized protein n=1 Tax=Scheffersomyces amazonensis TaxID=1078765 RepID=UPI00315DE225